MNPKDFWSVIWQYRETIGLISALIGILTAIWYLRGFIKSFIFPVLKYFFLNTLKSILSKLEILIVIPRFLWRKLYQLLVKDLNSRISNLETEVSKLKQGSQQSPKTLTGILELGVYWTFDPANKRGDIYYPRQLAGYAPNPRCPVDKKFELKIPEEISRHYYGIWDAKATYLDCYICETSHRLIYRDKPISFEKAVEIMKSRFS